jgi:hypothetical protein
MVPGIDPKVDYVFKILFGSEANKSLLIHLLNAVLKPPPGQQIVAVEILNPFNDKETLDDKLSILDIKARDQLVDADELPPTMRIVEVEKAMEKLKAINENEVERFRYLDRLKAQLDHNTMMQLGAHELERGRKDGIADLIQTCQQLLKLPVTPIKELLSLDLAILQTQANYLKGQLGLDVAKNL